MKTEITPPITIRPYDWAHLARLAQNYKVHPQVMLDTILSQAHYLPEALGEDQMRRELMSQALSADTYSKLDPEEMLERYEDALGHAPKR